MNFNLNKWQDSEGGGEETVHGGGRKAQTTPQEVTELYWTELYITGRLRQLHKR